MIDIYNDEIVTHEKGKKFMPDYKKLYAYLVGEIDEALTLMDDNDLLEWDHIKQILQTALWEVEDRASGGEGEAAP